MTAPRTLTIGELRHEAACLARHRAPDDRARLAAVRAEIARRETLPNYRDRLDAEIAAMRAQSLDVPRFTDADFARLREVAREVDALGLELDELRRTP